MSVSRREKRFTTAFFLLFHIFLPPSFYFKSVCGFVGFSQSKRRSKQCHVVYSHTPHEGDKKGKFPFSSTPVGSSSRKSSSSRIGSRTSGIMNAKIRP